MLAVQGERSSRQRFTDTVIVGKDLLELLSSAMYVDPLTIYREFIQNAADAIDEAADEGLYSGKTHWVRARSAARQHAVCGASADSPVWLIAKSSSSALNRLPITVFTRCTGIASG